MAFRPPEIHGVDPPPPGVTPGVSVASENGFRPFSGRSRICLLVTTVDIDEVSVESCAAFAETSTVVAVSPIFNSISSVTVCCTLIVRLLCTYLPNPAFSTVTR